MSEKSNTKKIHFTTLNHKLHIRIGKNKFQTNNFLTIKATSRKLSFSSA